MTLRCASQSDWLWCLTFTCEGCREYAKELQRQFAAKVAAGEFDDRGYTLAERGKRGKKAA